MRFLLPFLLLAACDGNTPVKPRREGPANTKRADRAALKQLESSFQDYRAETTRQIDALEVRLAEQTSRASQAIANERAKAAENEAILEQIKEARAANHQLRKSIGSLSEELRLLNEVMDKNRTALDGMMKRTRELTEENLRLKQELAAAKSG